VTGEVIGRHDRYAAERTGEFDRDRGLAGAGHAVDRDHPDRATTGLAPPDRPGQVRVRNRG
jgi:hypothetical protein